jgi:decaprenylphospho-beta-D-erythro-pentofuranosid-2-ulose 2-reductase
MKDALGAVQTVLLLGGTSEIGLAIVRALLARRSVRVVLAGRNVQALGTEAKALEAEGASAVEVVPFDARDTKAHATFVDDVADILGDIDVTVFAFGLLGEQDRAEREVDHALDIVTTNYVGSVSVAMPLAERLRAQGHGTIVVLSSVAGERARRANFVYGSSKAGQDAFFQGLGDSLVGTGVHVLVVRPGFVKSRMTEGMQPAPLATTPQAVADAVVRALVRGGELVWVPSTLRYVMSVLRHLPRPLFRRLKV